MGKTFDISDKKISYHSIDDKDIISYIKAIRNGFTFVVFHNFAKKTPFSLQDWSRFLNMSERTMQRHKSEKKSFDPIYAERILQITLLYNLGIEVFGEKDQFDAWLETKNLALGKIAPKELLDNSFGIGLLKDELTRIEHGVLA
jgi:putative toxin-antitoxin system antitoxin component (TIGR02293 family)